MALKSFRVEMFGSFEIVDIDSRLVLSVNRVAVTLGISVETLRRWIRTGKFPPAVIHARAGKADYWLQIDIVEWQKTQHLEKIAAPKRALFKNMDAIDREEARRFGVRPIDEQELLRRLPRVKDLLANDPKTFVGEFPKLKKWVEGKPVKK